MTQLISSWMARFDIIAPQFQKDFSPHFVEHALDVSLSRIEGLRNSYWHFFIVNMSFKYSEFDLFKHLWTIFASQRSGQILIT